MKYICAYGNIGGMVKLRLKELLKEHGRTLYWLRNQTGIRYATLLNMREGRTARIDLSALEALCRALECEPGELLELKPKLKRKSGLTKALAR